jgi:hypothetical protein
MVKASGPATRIMAIAPMPGAVDTAHIVESVISIFCFVLSATNLQKRHDYPTLSLG